MGLSIGQSLGFFQPARIAPQFQRTERAPEFRPRIGFSIDSEDRGRANPFARPERVFARAGFGEGTISAPGAAVIALRRGLQSARQITTPPPRERPDFSERIAGLREARTQRNARAAAARRADRNFAVATNQARNFINDVNEAAGAALARIRGEEPAGAAGATIEIGGETFQFGAAGATSDSVTFTDGGGRLRINALV